MPRIRPNLQLQKSAVIGSILVSDALNEAVYFPPGANGSVLSVVAGVPTYTTLSPASFILSSGGVSTTITSGDTLTITAGNGLTSAVTLTGSDILALSAKLSVDAGNDLSFGADGGLFVAVDRLLTGVTWDDPSNSLVFTFDRGVPSVSVPITGFLESYLATFTIAANSGVADQINNQETISFLGGVGVTTAVSNNTITITADNAKQTFTALATGASVTLSVVPGKTTLVTRNGLEQEITVDYSVLGAVYTFTTAFGTSTGSTGTETVVITYEVA